MLAAVALAVLALAFALGQGGRTPGMARAAAAGLDADLGYVAADVIVQQTDADGQLQYELQAARIEQQSENSPIRAQALTLQYEPVDRQGVVIPGRQWSLRANEGVLPGDSGVLELEGDVEVSARLQNTARPIIMRTERLTYDTRNQLLDSRAQVIFVWGSQQMQGQGLTANIRAGTLALESGVHGRISP